MSYVVARQHLNASHSRSSIWLNPNVFIFSGNYFSTTLIGHIPSTVKAFGLIPKLTARHKYQISFGSNYINVIQCDLHCHYLDIDTTKKIRNNPSGSRSNTIKYKFMTWIWSLFCPQMSSHIWEESVRM